MASVTIDSPEIPRASLHKSLPWYTHLYTVPLLCLYPVLAYAYYVKYDEWLVSEEWTFLACATLGSGTHSASSLLVGVQPQKLGLKQARCQSCSLHFSSAYQHPQQVCSIEQADSIRIVPEVHRGKGEIVPSIKEDAKDVSSYTFNYQRGTYSVAKCSSDSITFIKLPYPSSGNPSQVRSLFTNSGTAEFNIPIPSFTELFSEHATAPFFVFQIFYVALWCLDEYWYYSLLTLSRLVVFECTVVWQRVRTLTELRTMSVKPYSIFTYRDAKWQEISSEGLLPGDIVSVNRHQSLHYKPVDAKSKDKETKETKEAHSHEETTVPADILLLHGQVIIRPRNPFSLLLILSQSSTADGVPEPSLKTPDNCCLGVILRTGFGTAQGQLVRHIFSTERVSANNMESFLFIGFLLIFAVAASAYVWIKGIERDLKKSKLLLDCVLMITRVVPPELPMELSLAVNASLVALSNYVCIPNTPFFLQRSCTEPFRIPFAGRVDVCCFDKTGTITAENLVLEGVTGVR
ncbi:hypothetical protein C8J55DRAFT_589866 [Lentinula edodes]|uniref:P5A-ATPase transmembrane helical hairpin domain-containing protein n=1 Tax=Lentinula lateritia TaxID=40482 RepID=A0A9W8ZSY1_9AGAR|nr:hypothetical protein C8J55DRAFT_589857 [Lentinula edodes]KAJ4464916.1 hypothetical protein C8J55DRAFT_589866 [Lentinula edodes]